MDEVKPVVMRVKSSLKNIPLGCDCGSCVLHVFLRLVDNPLHDGRRHVGLCPRMNFLLEKVSVCPGGP